MNRRGIGNYPRCERSAVSVGRRVVEPRQPGRRRAAGDRGQGRVALCETRRVNAWGPVTFGDPCRECGFDWNITADDAVAVVLGAPAAYRDALRDASGSESTPDLVWNVTAYVAHVADNLRVWGERLAAAGGSDEPITLVSYDSDALASARRYDSLPLTGVLWGLSEAAASWVRAWKSSNGPDWVLLHAERGPISAEDIARTNAHDIVHHQFDLRRCLAPSAAGP